jgi:hypothetical protein
LKDRGIFDGQQLSIVHSTSVGQHQPSTVSAFAQHRSSAVQQGPSQCERVANSLPQHGVFTLSSQQPSSVQKSLEMQQVLSGHGLWSGGQVQSLIWHWSLQQ